MAYTSLGQVDLSADSRSELSSGSSRSKQGSELDASFKPIPAEWVVCKVCEEVDTPVEAMPGNGWVEFVLYLFWIAPGVVYSVWRRKGKRKVCSCCGSADVVSANSKAGRRIIGTMPVQVPSGLRSSPRTKVVQPQFGKLTSILLGAISAFCILEALLLSYMAVSQNQGNGLLGLGAVLLTIGWLCGYGSIRAWKAKPVVIDI